jgi:WD40 repeat protein/serine/threonine protein kinase
MHDEREGLGDRKDSRPLFERLLEYDAALAAGARPEVADVDELPADLREGFSCLEMLEHLRVSDSISRLFGPASAAPPRDRSGSDTEAERIGQGETQSVPAQLGRFQIRKLIGQGGCGVVFLADDPSLHRQVAIKLPRPEALLTPELRQRFLREGRAAACLDHPNIVTVFEAGEVGAICYLASAYCPGITLREWIRKQGGPAPPRGAAELIATLARAMDYAHRSGVCHRDLKPSNVLLQIADGRWQIEPGETKLPIEPGADAKSAICNLQSKIPNLKSAIPKIIDFGLAKVFHGDSAEAGTRTGAIFGTPHYMAPEQAQGQTQTIGPATDIHAMGVILYELLTGRVPYQGDTDLEVLSRVVNAEPASQCLGKRAPRDLETICLKCLQKQPENRYGSMSELADDLERFLDGRPILGRRTGWAARAAKWVRRRPRTAAGGAVACTLLAALLGTLIWIGGRESDHRKALQQEIDLRQAAEEEQDWLARNNKYAAQIRLGATLKANGEWGPLRDLLLDHAPGADQKDLRGFEWHYLWRSGHGFNLPPLLSGVTALAYSQRGALCASGSKDGTIHLYERGTGRLKSKLHGLSFEVRTLDFLKDDAQLLSTAMTKTPGGDDFRGEFILWDLSGEPRILRRASYSHRWQEWGAEHFTLARAARVLFIIDRSDTCHRLLRLDLETGAEQEVLRDDRLHLVATSPNADRVAITYYRATVEIREPSTKRRIAVAALGATPHWATFAPDGKTLVLGVEMDQIPYRVEIRDSATLELKKSLEFRLVPYRITYDWAGNRFAITTNEDCFHIYAAKSGDCLASYQRLGCSRLAFAPDGDEMALGDYYGLVRTGKNVFGHWEYSLPGPLPKSEAWSVAFSPDGNTLVAGYDHADKAGHETLRLWDMTSKKAKAHSDHVSTVTAVAISPDGKKLATGSFDRSVRLWDMSTQKCLQEWRNHTNAVRALVFSPDGQWVASAGSDLSIKIWDVNLGPPRASWQGHTDVIRSLAFSPDGKLLISAANDRAIKIWDAADGTPVRTIADEAKVQGIACSPDGALLASANENNKVEIWRLGSGELLRTLPGHTGKVRCVAFSPDGKTLASGGEDKTVRLWNVVNGQELLVFSTTHFVNSLSFNPRKPILAAALHDGTVKLWSGE